MAINYGIIPAYTDQLSEQLIATAVLNTDLMEFVDLKAGYSSGTVSINLVDNDISVLPYDCATPAAGNINYTQVDVTVADLKSYQALCINTLRDIYQSAFMSPSMANDNLPFEEVISNQFVEKLQKYNERFIIKGNISEGGAATGVETQLKASTATVPAASAAWTVNNAIDQALDLYDAIDESVINREDIAIVCGPAAYRTLVRALVAQGGAGLFNYVPVESNQIILLPGTNARVIMTSGLTGNDFAFAGPMKLIQALTGLTDEMSSFRFVMNEVTDELLFKAAYRLGVGIGQANVFSHNNLV